MGEAEEPVPADKQPAEKRGITRRNFLKGMLVAGAVAGAATVRPEVEWLLLPGRKVTPIAPSPGANLIPPGWLKTSGNQIIAADGKPVLLNFANWQGGETEGLVPGMLDRISVDDCTKWLYDQGFNGFRLPWCVTTVLESARNGTAVDPAQVKGDPALYSAAQNGSLTPLDVYDAVIASAKRNGLRVLIDCHRITPGWSGQPSGLPYTPEHPISTFLSAWKLMAERYKNDPTVIGYDIFNEPGKQAGSVTFEQGAVWGGGGPKDFAALAELTGNILHEINPEGLVVVEGVMQDPRGPRLFGMGPALPYGPGGNLCGVRERPIQLRNPNHLVYQIHDYDFDGGKWPAWMWFFLADTPAACRSVWDQAFGFIAKEKIAPVFVGEFGTNNGTNQHHPAYAYTDSDTPEAMGKWFTYLTDYIYENNLSWAYWPMNGVKAPAGAFEGYGLMTPDGKGVASVPLMNKLHLLQTTVAERTAGRHSRSRNLE